MQPNSTLWQMIAWLVVILIIAGCAWVSRDHWQPVLNGTASQVKETESDSGSGHRHAAAELVKESVTVEVNQQARQNLGLESKPVMVQNFWRKIR